MILKLNNMYSVDGGFIVPLTRYKKQAKERYAIFKKVEEGPDHYVVHHVTYNHEELQELFKVKKKERIEIE